MLLHSFRCFEWSSVWLFYMYPYHFLQWRYFLSHHLQYSACVWCYILYILAIRLCGLDDIQFYNWAAPNVFMDKLDAIHFKQPSLHQVFVQHVQHVQHHSIINKRDVATMVRVRSWATDARKNTNEESMEFTAIGSNNYWERRGRHDTNLLNKLGALWSGKQLWEEKTQVKEKTEASNEEELNAAVKGYELP